MIDVGDLMRTHEEKKLVWKCACPRLTTWWSGLAGAAQAAENQMQVHESHQMDCWRKLRSRRTAVVGEEEIFTRVREIVHFLCVLSSAGVSALPVSGVGLPSQASGPPAVMKSMYHASRLLRLLLH